MPEEHQKVSFFGYHKFFKYEHLRLKVLSYGAFLAFVTEIINRIYESSVISPFYLIYRLVTKMYQVFVFVGIFSFANGYGKPDPFCSSVLQNIYMYNQNRVTFYIFGESLILINGNLYRFGSSDKKQFKRKIRIFALIIAS